MKQRTHIFVSKMLEQFELTVCAFGQNGRAEWLHDLLDCHRLACKLILCRTMGQSVNFGGVIPRWKRRVLPDEAKGTHAHGLEVSVSLRGQFGGA